MTSSYKGLQEVTRDHKRGPGGDKRLQKGYKELQGVTRGYKDLQEVTGGYRGLQRIIETFF